MKMEIIFEQVQKVQHIAIVEAIDEDTIDEILDDIDDEGYTDMDGVREKLGLCDEISVLEVKEEYDIDTEEIEFYSMREIEG